MQARCGFELHMLGAEGAALTAEISIDFDGDGTWDFEELFPEFRPAAGSLVPSLDQTQEGMACHLLSQGACKKHEPERVSARGS